MDKCRCRTILYAGKFQMNQTNEFFRDGFIVTEPGSNDSQRLA